MAIRNGLLILCILAVGAVAMQSVFAQPALDLGSPRTHPMTLLLTLVALAATLMQGPIGRQSTAEALLWLVVLMLALAYPFSKPVTDFLWPDVPLGRTGWNTGLAFALLAMAQWLRTDFREWTMLLMVLGLTLPVSGFYWTLFGSEEVRTDMAVSTVALLVLLYGANLMRMFRHPIMQMILSKRRTGRILRLQLLCWGAMLAGLPLAFRLVSGVTETALPWLQMIESWTFIATTLFFTWQLTSIIEKGRRSEKRLMTDLNRDQLTSAATRRAAIDYFMRLNPNRAVGLILLDIDHFKSFNDRFGHDCGDRVLASVAETIRPALGARELLARWGGEEFLVIVRTETNADLVQRAEMLRLAVRRATDVAGLHDRLVTASFGCCLCLPERASSLETGLSIADAALYRAKVEGRDRVVLANNGGQGWEAARGTSKEGAAETSLV